MQWQLVLYVQTCYDFLYKLGQEFEDRLNELKPRVAFIANPFMKVDVSESAEQMAELFSVRTVELKMEIINLQDDIRLKSKQHSQHLQSLGV